jgi:hypothetical protein
LTQASSEKSRYKEDGEQKRLFANVQGDIPRGFNKPEVRLIFFNVPGDNIEKGREFVRHLTAKYLVLSNS